MKKKQRALIFIVVAIAAFIIIRGNKDNNIFSEENCPDTYIPCVNAIADKNSVKVFNGTSSLEKEDGSFVYGDVFVVRNLDSLIVDKNEIVTLEFINKKPRNIHVYQVDGDVKKEIDINQHTFMAPNNPGTYKYELIAEYSHGTVNHYLKLKVKYK